MFHINIVKISENLNKWNLFKICIQLPTLSIFAYTGAIFTMKKYLVVLKRVTIIILFVHRELRQNGIA